MKFNYFPIISTISLNLSLLSSGTSAFAEDRDLHTYGCSQDAIAAANEASSKLLTSSGNYWIAQSFATKKMGSSYEVIMRNRDDDRCVLIQIETYQGPNYCKIIDSKVTQLKSLGPNDNVRSLCEISK